MMSYKGISPNLQAILAKDAELGDLCFFCRSGKSLPVLIVEYQKQSEQVKGFLKLQPDWNLIKPVRLNDLIVLKVIDEWRFRLNPTIPVESEIDPNNVPYGKIIIAPEGIYMGAKIPTDYDSGILMDIQKGTTAAEKFKPGIDYYYAGWAIEIRANGAAPWEQMHEPGFTAE